MYCMYTVCMNCMYFMYCTCTCMYCMYVYVYVYVCTLYMYTVYMYRCTVCIVHVHVITYQSGISVVLFIAKEKNNTKLIILQH